MTESFRVARRGGEAEFRAFLGLPVILLETKDVD
jgi:hypothetical protein